MGPIAPNLKGGEPRSEAEEWGGWTFSGGFQGIELMGQGRFGQRGVFLFFLGGGIVGLGA